MTHLMTHHPSPYFRVLNRYKSLATTGLPYFLLPIGEKVPVGRMRGRKKRREWITPLSEELGGMMGLELFNDL